MTVPFGKFRDDRAKQERWLGNLLFLTTAGFVILAWAAVNAGGQAPDRRPSQRVLVLYSDERLLPANLIVDQAINTVFAADNSKRIELYSEFLDVARFPGEEQRQRQRVFLREKYRERPPDLMIAVSGDAFAFLTERRTELFAAVPIVYCSVAGDSPPTHLSDTGVADVPVPDTAARTLEMMLRLHPDTRRVAVVSGSGPRDRQFSDVFREELRHLREPGRFHLAGQSFHGAIAQRIVAPPGSHPRAVPHDVPGCGRRDVHPSSGAGNVRPGEPCSDLRSLRNLRWTWDCRRLDCDVRGYRPESRRVGHPHPRRRRRANRRPVGVVPAGPDV